jgi:ABC-type thiamin/hydroxymethylpyrimidine transport system permease subunit
MSSLTIAPRYPRSSLEFGIEMAQDWRCLVNLMMARGLGSALGSFILMFPFGLGKFATTLSICFCMLVIFAWSVVMFKDLQMYKLITAEHQCENIHSYDQGY